MPVKKCSNGNYRIGSGDCVYETKSKAEEAQAAMYAEKNKEDGGIACEEGCPCKKCKRFSKIKMKIKDK